MTDVPIVLTLDRADALQVVAILTQAAAIAQVWFEDSEEMEKACGELGPKMLEQIIAQTEVSFGELKELSKKVKVSRSGLASKVLETFDD